MSDNQNSIEEKVMEIVREQLNVTDGVTLSTSFIDDLDADSLDTVELVMAFEEAFVSTSLMKKQKKF